MTFLRNRKLAVFAAVALAVLALDQISKAVVMKHIPLHAAVEVAPGYFDLVHARNPGGAFGLLSKQVSVARSWLFVGISMVALGVVLLLVAAPGDPPRLLLLAYSLFFGGALGNLIDRVRFGEVVDFLDFHVEALHWPAFNVADSSLCVGVGFFLLHIVTAKDAQS